MAPRHDNDADESGDRAGRKDEITGMKDALIERRGFLAIAGAAAVAGAAASTMGTARGATVDLGAEGLSPGDDLTSYLEDHWAGGNQVHIPAGEYKLSSPEALGISTSENAALVGGGEVVLDHSGESVDFNITAEGSAHIRFANLTLRGVDPGNESRIAPWAPDDGILEFINFNRPDGCVDGGDATGFYVPGEHAGLLRFINCHVEGFSNNGLYASSPGKEANGPVEVYGGLYKNNDVAGVRLGSAGSKAISVSVVNDATAPGISGGNSQRGIRMDEPGPAEIRDCDITHLDESGVSAPIDVENESFNSSRDGGIVVTDTRVRNDVGSSVIDCESDEYDSSGDTLHLDGSGDLSLEGSGPYTNVHRGNGANAPTTKKRIVDPGSLEPVDGGGGGGSGRSGGNTTSDTKSSDGDSSDGDGSGDENDSDAASSSRVEVVAKEGGSLFSYTIVASGTISKVTDAGEMSASGNDSVSRSGDGRSTVNGEVGNGYGDTYRVEGDVLSFEADTDARNYTFTIDGQEVDSAGVGESGDSNGGSEDSGGGASSDGSNSELPNLIVIEGTPDGRATYFLEVTGELKPEPSIGPMDPHGTLAESTVEGMILDDVDAFRFSGDVVDFELDGEATVTIEDGT